MEPTKEMLEYADRHNLRYNPVGRGGWVFESTSGSVPFSMHYSEIEQLAKSESRPTPDAADDGYWLCRKCSQFNYPSQDWCQECDSPRPRR